MYVWDRTYTVPTTTNIRKLLRNRMNISDTSGKTYFMNLGGTDTAPRRGRQELNWLRVV